MDSVEMLGPVLVAMLTVPIQAGVKRLASVMDKLPAWVQQLLTLVIAWVLTQAGSTVNPVLPEPVQLFSASDTSALISAGMAWAIHAGKKAREK